nr:hypothetical protein Iba_chr04dCG14360 [Ipomoea batatas]
MVHHQVSIILRVVISSSSKSDSTETEESSSSEASPLLAERSSTDFGGFVHQLFADPLVFPSHLPASPALSVLSGGPNSLPFSPLARGPSDFEDFGDLVLRRGRYPPFLLALPVSYCLR